MLEQELLLTLAEISVTIAALSAVAGVVKHEALDVVASGLLRDVAIIGMLVALYAFLPLVFWSDDTIIALRVCAVGAAITWLIGYALYLRGALRDRSQITSTFWMGMVITLLGLALLVFCIFSEGKVGITLYLAGMIAWLAIAGLNFVASVFSSSRPAKQ